MAVPLLASRNRRNYFFVPLLLGLGVDELSTAPPVVPQIKYLIQRIDFSAAKDLATFALASESAGDILERCLQFLGDAVPGLLDMAQPPFESPGASVSAELRKDNRSYPADPRRDERCLGTAPAYPGDGSA